MLNDSLCVLGVLSVGSVVKTGQGTVAKKERFGYVKVNGTGG
jgi:hypothetical protein